MKNSNLKNHKVFLKSDKKIVLDFEIRNIVVFLQSLE